MIHAFALNVLMYKRFFQMTHFTTLNSRVLLVLKPCVLLVLMPRGQFALANILRQKVDLASYAYLASWTFVVVQRDCFVTCPTKWVNTTLLPWDVTWKRFLSCTDTDLVRFTKRMFGSQFQMLFCRGYMPFIFYLNLPTSIIIDIMIVVHFFYHIP